MNPDNQYGYIRNVEASLIESIVDRIKARFGEVNFLEIGVFGGETAKGIVRKCQAIGVPVKAAGVDFPEWKPVPAPVPDYAFYACDSMDAWRDIKGKFNFLFIDGCHCVNHSMCDFLNYSPFLVVGGYCLFHDTATHKGRATQDAFSADHSYAGKPDSTLGVRDGLKKVGILQGHRTDWKFVEEVTSDNGLMGMCLFEKLSDL